MLWSKLSLHLLLSHSCFYYHPHFLFPLGPVLTSDLFVLLCNPLGLTRVTWVGVGVTLSSGVWITRQGLHHSRKWLLLQQPWTAISSWVDPMSPSLIYDWMLTSWAYCRLYAASLAIASSLMLETAHAHKTAVHDSSCHLVLRFFLLPSLQCSQSLEGGLLLWSHLMLRLSSHLFTAPGQAMNL